jgi:hypothetical protein
MITQAIWWVAIFLEALLLFRGFRAKLILRFPVFYSYIAFVFCEELLRFFVYRWRPEIYPQAYWITEFLGLMLGSVIVFEIYFFGLSAYAGAARMARNVLLFVFVLIFAKSLVSASYGAIWWPAQTTVELERNLRIVQACALVALLALLVLYAIPVGRALKGILLGYGLFVAVSVIQLTLTSYFGNVVQRLWFYVQPLSYLLVLGIWVKALWTYQASPETAGKIKLEHDYQALITATTRRMQRARRSLGMLARP